MESGLGSAFRRTAQKTKKKHPGLGQIIVGGIFCVISISILIKAIYYAINPTVARNMGALPFIFSIVNLYGILQIINGIKAIRSRVCFSQDRTKLPIILKRINHIRKEKLLTDIAIGAPLPEAGAAAAARIKNEEILISLVKDRRLPVSVRMGALSGIRSEDALSRVIRTLSGYVSDDVTLIDTALDRLSHSVLFPIARDANNTNALRASAYQHLGRDGDSYLMKLTDPHLNDQLRREAGEQLLETGNSALAKQAITIILKMEFSDMKLTFLSDAARKYPILFQGLWPRISSWAHSDSTKHEDAWSNGQFHVDRTEYYDYYRYPNGETVANKSGRRKHKDYQVPSSDCNEHTDNNHHTDNNRDNDLKRFPAAIRSE